MASHPIDDFLSELDNIYRHYDAFIASLPCSLQRLAGSEKRLSARMMNRMFLLFPFWFMDGLGLSYETCRGIACGNAYGLLHYLILDWIIDADEGLSSEWLLLGDLFYAQAIQGYLSVIPAGAMDHWWAYMRQAMIQHTQGGLMEKGRYKVEDEYTDPEILLMLRGAMFQICGYTLALASSREKVGPALARAIDCFNAGFTILDDLQDWQQDSQHGLCFNAVLRLAAFGQDGNLSWQHIDAALEKSHAYLIEAKRCVAHLNAHYWNIFLDHFIEEARLLKNKLTRQLYQNVIVQRKV